MRFYLLRDAGVQVRQVDGEVRLRGMRQSELANEVGRKRVEQRLGRLEKLFIDPDKVVGGITDGASALRSSDLSTDTFVSLELDPARSIDLLLVDIEGLKDGVDTGYFDRSAYARSGLRDDEITQKKIEFDAQRKAALDEKRRLSVLAQQMKQYQKAAKALYENLRTLIDAFDQASRLELEAVLPDGLAGLKDQLDAVGERRGNFSLEDVGSLLRIEAQLADYIGNDGNFAALATEISEVKTEVKDLGNPDNSKREIALIAATLRAEHPEWNDEQVSACCQTEV